MSRDAQPALPAEGYVRFRQIKQVFPVSRPTWERGVRKGIYPPSYRLGEGMTGWLAADIRELLAQVKRGETPHWPPGRAAA